MISKEHRFHGHGSLRRTYNEGQIARGPMFSVRVAGAKQENYKAAVVVSKKISGSAVERNLIRRRLYEAIRQQEPGRLDSKNIIINVFNNSVAKVKFDDLQKELQKLLDQIKA